MWLEVAARLKQGFADSQLSLLVAMLSFKNTSHSSPVPGKAGLLPFLVLLLTPNFLVFKWMHSPLENNSVRYTRRSARFEDGS